MAGSPERWLIVLLAGCGTADDEPSGLTKCGDSVLDWSTFGDPFFRSWCTGCHHSALPEEARSSAPVGVNFDSLAGVRAEADRIRVRAIEQSTMPPGGGPDQASLGLLDEWLRCGAPGTTTVPSDTALPPPDTGPPVDETGSCERAGHWTVVNVACGGLVFTDEWFSLFTATEFTITADGDTCAIEYLRADVGCEEVQVWRSDLASPSTDVSFQAVTSCVPAACSFLATPYQTCSVGPMGIDAVLPVTDLAPDRIQLGPFAGGSSYCTSMSFELLRVP